MSSGIQSEKRPPAPLEELQGRWLQIKHIHHPLAHETIDQLFSTLESEAWPYWIAYRVGDFVFINTSEKGDLVRRVAIMVVEGEWLLLQHVATIDILEEDNHALGQQIWDTIVKQQALSTTPVRLYQMEEVFGHFHGVDMPGFELKALM